MQTKEKAWLCECSKIARYIFLDFLAIRQNIWYGFQRPSWMEERLELNFMFMFQALWMWCWYAELSYHQIKHCWPIHKPFIRIRSKFGFLFRVLLFSSFFKQDLWFSLSGCQVQGESLLISPPPSPCHLISRQNHDQRLCTQKLWRN